MLPLRLFADSVFTVISAAAFVATLSLFAAIVFLPVFLQLVTGASATRSGLLTLPLLVASALSTTIAGQIMARTGRYKLFPVIGLAAMSLGLLLFTEVMFPWMFREASQLRPFAEAADLLAQAADLLDLYEPDRLARNEVPVFALLYADDVYTPNDLQLETARQVANVHVLMTDEFHHNGLMRNGTLMARLLDMAKRTVRTA